jgi:hypothetical protein
LASGIGHRRAKLIASRISTADNFEKSVDIHEDTIVVGAQLKDGP